MAASGFVGIPEAAALEVSMNRRIPRVQLVKLKGIFHGNFEKSGVRNGSNIAKCLEQLNGVIPSSNIQPYLKTSISRDFTGLFGNESFCNRLGRSPSTDSIAVSNFSSDQGSIDSCQYSSNGSDSNSGSSPSSPEEPDRNSRAGSPQYSFQSEDQCEQNFITDTTTHFRTIASNGEVEPLLSQCEQEYNTDSEHFRTDTESGKMCETNSGKSTHSYLQETDFSMPNSSFEAFHNYQESSREDDCRTLVVDHKTNFASCSSNSTNQSISSSTTHLQQCHWLDCIVCIEGSTELVEHIRTEHVLIQKDKESFACRWVGCKVYNRSSCSLSWLERHILSHGGNKPFKCIVDNCSQHFPSQAALQRHVNSHFDHQPHQNGKLGKSRDDSTKSFKRKRHQKYKKRSAIGKTEDFFDANIMEQIRYRLVDDHANQPLASTNNSRSITFHSKIKAIRKDLSGEVKVLLQWIPENILPDCWVSQKSIIRSKTVPRSSLPLDSLTSSLTPDACDKPPRVKQRRK